MVWPTACAGAAVPSPRADALTEPPIRFSASIVVYRPDLDLLRRVLGGLQAATAEAGFAADSPIHLIDNGGLPADFEKTLSLPGMRVHRGHGNLGYGRGHNLVLGELQSDLHLILNPDAVLERDALKAARRFLDANPECGLLAPDVRGPNGRRQHLCKRYPSILDLVLRGFAPEWLRRRFAGRLARYERRDCDGTEVVWNPAIVSGCFMLWRTPVLKSLNGFDPAFFLYFEDFDLSLRAAQATRTAYVPSVRILHSGGNAARKGPRHVALFARSAARFFSRHGWRVI